MTFTHRDDGTPEAEWAAAIERHAPTEVQDALLAELDHVVVVAAHPDDETLGTAGLLAKAYAAGVRTSVLIATSGESSHPESSTHRPEELARIREQETAEAVAAMSPGATVEFARLPDGGLADPASTADLRRRLEALVGVAPDDDAAADRAHDDAHDGGVGNAPGPFGDGAAAAPGARAGESESGDASRREPARVLLISPWGGDRHPDHEAASEVVAGIAREHGLWHLAYPIWLWHWAAPDDAEVPWDDLVAVPLAPEVLVAKQHALELHVSQVSPLSGLPGDEVLLHEGMLEHFSRSMELFVDLTAHPEAGAGTDAADTADDLTTAPAVLHDRAVATDYFDRLHERADDPWGFESRWYEERKRAVLLASLPEKEVEAVLEVGCSTGVLSAALLERTTRRFLGVDISEVALARARARARARIPSASASAPAPASATAPAPVADFERMLVPAEWPDGAFDLVVVSEVGYYLDDGDLDTLITRILDGLTEGGTIVCCHWRHPVTGRTATGDSVHAAFAVRPALARLATHLEEDFVLDVFTRAPAVSVARREGIL